MTREPKITRDGFAALLGVDSSVVPSIIPPDKAAFAGNVVFRGGFAATRPGFNQRGLTYPTDEIANWIEDNVLQGAAVFRPKYGQALIIASIGGRIFSIDPANVFTVQEVTPVILTTVSVGFVAPAVGATVVVTLVDQSKVQPGYPIEINGEAYSVVSVQPTTITVENVAATPGPVTIGTPVQILDVNSYINGRAWMIQAEVFMIIQDGQGRAIIFDGTNCKRSNPSTLQVPTGTVMAYGLGRLWVAVLKNQFVAGDIVRGSSGTAFYDFLDAILYFKENTYVAGGGAFSVPIESGEITAMQFMPVLDTSTGNGPLLIFTERGAFSVNASPDRTTWADTRSPIQTVVLTGAGSTSQYATVPTTNSDIFFRAGDGLRSFVLAMRMFTNSWGNTPISTELDRVLKYDETTLLKYASAFQFDNRLWFTVAPIPLPGKEQGAYHQGMATLDFHAISNMGQKSPPDYDGVHSGIQPTLLFKGLIDGVERAFAWSLNLDGHNELWEMSKSEPFDNGDGRIKSFLETRSYVGNAPTTMKRVEGFELFIDDVRGEVLFTLFYRPDQYSCWLEWGRGQSICVNWRDCPTGSVLCTEPITYRPGYKTRINFGQPPDVDQLVDDKPSRLGYEHQFRIEWEGHCRIRKGVARFQEIDEEQYPTVN